MPMKPEIHKATVPNARRHAPERSTAAYDATWQRLRLMTLRKTPMCEDCQRTAAVHVHHIKTVRQRPDLRLDPTNLKALCHSCHSRHHATHRGE
jgi:5-methylcytosine-specific restriction endonuclease McrA